MLVVYHSIVDQNNTHFITRNFFRSGFERQFNLGILISFLYCVKIAEMIILGERKVFLVIFFGDFSPWLLSPIVFVMWHHSTSW
jgi:hypothetical protein